MQKYCSEDCQAEAKRLRKKRQQDLINGIEPIMDLQHSGVSYLLQSCHSDGMHPTVYLQTCG